MCRTTQMKSYMDILINKSSDAKVVLKDAFLHSGASDSTYYRACMGHNLRYETALAVEKSIDKLQALQNRDSST